MSGQIKVDFSSLAELQSQVSSAAQKILTEIEDIKRTVNGTQAYWEKALQGAMILIAVVSDAIQLRQRRDVGASLAAH